MDMLIMLGELAMGECVSSNKMKFYTRFGVQVCKNYIFGSATCVPTRAHVPVSP